MVHKDVVTWYGAAQSFHFYAARIEPPERKRERERERERERLAGCQVYSCISKFPKLWLTPACNVLLHTAGPCRANIDGHYARRILNTISPSLRRPPPKRYRAHVPKVIVALFDSRDVSCTAKPPCEDVSRRQRIFPPVLIIKCLSPAEFH